MVYALSLIDDIVGGLGASSGFSIRTLFHLAGYGWLDGGRLGV